jgi:threonine dehydrogenase-like Zn-dependent dehydrogenase
VDLSADEVLRGRRHAPARRDELATIGPIPDNRRGVVGEDAGQRGQFAYAGLGNHTIVTTLCPGGKERMRRLMAVIEAGQVDLGAMVTHRFGLEEIEAAYELCANQRDGVLKVAITQ